MKGPRRPISKAVAPHLVGLLLASLLPACTPNLNWRTVQLGNLATLLPCKPDSGRRMVQLAGQSVPMDMSGCAVGDAMFTVSRVQAPDAQQASNLLLAMRQAALLNVRATALHPWPNSGDDRSSLDLQVDGQRLDGKSMQARFKWLLQGNEIYQLAAYADQLGAEQTENLVQQARIN